MPLIDLEFSNWALVSVPRIFALPSQVPCHSPIAEDCITFTIIARLHHRANLMLTNGIVEDISLDQRGIVVAGLICETGKD